MVLIQENVARFDVSVQNTLLFVLIRLRTSVGLSSVDWRRFSPPVTEVKRIDELAEDLPYELFADGLATAALLALLDHLLEVALLAVLHDNVDFEIFLVDAPVVIPHYVGVVQVSENVDF